MRVKITADSTCDLPAALAEASGIGILPLYIIRDGESLKDGAEITTPQVFDYTRRTGKLCGTSAVTIVDYEAAWTEWKKEYDAVIHVSLSSELSASYGNACIAAAEVGNVWVVDSRSLSTGTGHLALDAARMAGEGMDAAGIAAELARLAEKLDVSFVLDTLDYLRKGGRCSAVQALGANLLGLKPCIEVRDGAMGVGKKYRGKIEKAFVQYITDRLRDRDDIDTRRIFITDSGISDEMRAELEAAVRACQPFEEVLHSLSGCVISGHCGPWCMGILYYHK